MKKAKGQCCLKGNPQQPRTSNLHAKRQAASLSAKTVYGGWSVGGYRVPVSYNLYTIDKQHLCYNRMWRVVCSYSCSAPIQSTYRRQAASLLQTYVKGGWLVATVLFSRPIYKYIYTPRQLHVSRIFATDNLVAIYAPLAWGNLGK